MDRTELEQNFREYLKYHVEDRDPRLVNFYMGAIMEEAFTDKEEKRKELFKLLEKEG